MKKKVHVFFVFLVLALLAAPSVWASTYYEDVTTNGQTIKPYCSDDKVIQINSGVTSFVIEPSKGAYSHSCSGKIYLNAPSEYMLAFSGDVTLSSGGSLIIYDGSGTSTSLYSKTNNASNSVSYTIPALYTTGNTANILYSHDGEINYGNCFKLTVVVFSKNATTVSTSGQPVYMPCSGVNQITVNSGVTSFYVYDDGGANYNYSNGCKGTIVLSAPSNHSFEISGYVNVADGNDSLRIYNSDLSSHSWTEPALMLERNSSTEFGSIYGTNSSVSIVFRTNGSGVSSGLILLVKVVETHGVMFNIPSTAGSVTTWIPWRKGQVFTSSETNYSINFAVGSRVPLKITENDGYVLTALDVHVMGDNTAYLDTYLYDDTLSFTMPSDMVSVSPSYSAIGNLYSINMLCREKTLNIPASVKSFRIYDNGGPSKNYTNSCNATLVLNAPEGYKVRLTGTVLTEAASGTARYDYLSIYNGNSRNSDSLRNVLYSTTSNQAVDIGAYTSSGQSMTLFFHSDVSYNNEGLNLIAELLPQYFTATVASVSNGSVTPASQSVLAGSTVTLTISPNSGYELLDLKAVTASGSNVPVSISGNKATFTMPGKNVTVTPTFGKYSVTVDASAPSGCLTPNRQYALSGSTVTLTSSCNGYVLTNATAKTSAGAAVSVTITDNKISFTMPRSDVIVTPTYVTDLYRVSKDDVTGGRLLGNDYAKYGSTVLLTAELDNGYLLNEVRVITQGSSLNVSGGRWYNADSSKKASFVMPLSNVTATLSVTNKLTAEDGGLFINMPKTGTVNAAIPTGVQSFKIYDDGGKDGYYSDNSDGTLVLNAPSGYVIELTGSIKTYAETHTTKTCISGDLWDGFYECYEYAYSTTYTCNTDDYLSAYDGSSTSTTALFMGKYGCNSSNGPSWNSVGKVVSTGNKMTLNFKSGTSGTNVGLDLTVTLRKVPMELEDDGNGGKYVNMVAQQTLNIPKEVKSFKIYDYGGKDGDYVNNRNSTLELLAPSGYVLELTGSIKTYAVTNTTETCISGESWDGFFKCIEYAYSTTYTCNTDDYLSVYDGLSTSTTALFTGKYGCNSSNGASWTSIGKVTSSGNKMTLNFKSDASGIDAGLDLTVTLRKLAMELEDDGDGGKYVNMLMVKGASLSIPKEVNSFKIYDDGGKNGYYSNNNNGVLELTAPLGYHIELTGTIKTSSVTNTTETCISGESWDGFFKCIEYAYSTTYTCNTDDYLSVYDGSSTSTTPLLTGKNGCNSSNGASWTSLDKVTSSGNKMTLNFKSDASGSSDGLDLTVSIVPVDYVVHVNSAENGKMIASKTTKLHVGDVVSLISVPNSGYMLKDVFAQDVFGNEVKVSQYSFSVSEFVMPAMDVVLTPTFTNTFTAAGGLHLDMRKNKNFDASVPGEIKSFKIYDNGGKDGAYEANSNDTLTLAAPEGYRMILTGSVVMEKNYEYLYVYDGENTKANTLLSTTGSANRSNTTSSTDIGSITSSGRYMTIRFHSDPSYQYAGLDLTVTIEKINYTVTINSATGGTLYGKDADTLGAEVYLTGSPSSSYHLSDVRVVDKDSNVVKSPIYSFDRSKFTLPASNVTVTPTFTNNLTAEGGLHLDMLKKGRENVNIPSGVKSFYLYDNGGKDGVYENYSRDTVTLVAPSEHRLKVTGSISVEAGRDSLYIFEGSNASGTRLFGRSSANSNTAYDIGTITSTGRSLTLCFTSDQSVQKAGLNLKISVVPITYGVTIAEVDHGRVSSDKAEAAKDSIVVLSWVYTTGYLIRDVDVKDASNNKVAVNGGWYSGAKATFTMPASSVTVTPSFTNNLTASGNDGLYINMPTTGTIDATIPKNVTSFKVYDDGGKDKAYSNNCNGTLVLTAPEGYVLELNGTVTAETPATDKVYDYLDVYNGSDKNAPILRQNVTGSSSVNGARSTGNAMTLYFKTDGNSVMSGLNLTVTLVPPTYMVSVATAAGGTLSSDKDSAAVGDKVTLTATPDEGYMLNGFIIKDASGNDVPFRGGDFIDKKGSFTMPVGDVTVTPVFTDKPVNLFVTIPVTGTKTVVLPDGMNSFKVYDDGGSTGLLTQGYNANGTLVLIAPDNAKINATVVAGVVSPATLKTYDGESTDATLLGSAQIGFREKYTSTGNAMTFNMTTGENVSGTADISINVLATRNINVVSVDGGSAASDKATADRNETITVTATPDDGLLFKGIKITNQFGDVLGMKGYETWVNDIWTADDIANLTQTVSFRMPNSDINVEPKFGEELEASDSVFLKMPETGSETVAIPPRVASFNVYDDGGRGGTFSSKSDGSLVLTAPKGYRFQVSGSVSAWAKDIAHLCVYEGGTVSDDKALACGTGSVFTAGTGQDYDSYVGEIGTTVSEGNTITLRFWATTTALSGTGNGIELVVTLLKPKYGAVTIARNDDGTSKAIFDGSYNGDEAIMITDSIEVDYVDYSRNFSTSGFSTIVLPFDVNTSNVSGLEKVAAFSEIKTNDAGRLVAVMSLVWKDSVGVPDTTLKANTPYMVLMNDGKFAVDGGVTLVPTVEPVVRSGTWEFRGTLAKRVWAEGDADLGHVYGFAAEERPDQNIRIGQFVKAGAGAWIRPGRAYLINVPETQQNHVGAGRPAIAALPSVVLPEDMDVVIEEQDGSTTFVGRFNARTGEFVKMKSRTYDLKGRNVNGKPRVKGMFIRK